MDKSKKLYIFSVISIVIIIGGLIGSYLFWGEHVNGQFGLFIPFTFLLWCAMNTAFKIPALVDIILLIVNLTKMRGDENRKYRRFPVIFIVLLAVSGVISVIIEFVMFLNTKGSSLG